MAKRTPESYGRHNPLDSGAYIDTVFPEPKATPAFKPTEQAAKKQSVTPSPAPATPTSPVTPTAPAPGRKILKRRGAGLAEGSEGTGAAVGYDGYPHSRNNQIGSSTVTPRPTTPITPANPVRNALRTNTVARKPKPQTPSTPKIDVTAKRQTRISKPTTPGNTITRPAGNNLRRPSAGLNPVKPATQTQGRRKNDPWDDLW